MKISYHWLKEYINVDLPAETIAGLLTGCGLEVEGIIPFQSVKGGLNGVVIGEVLTCVKHPNSDHLSLTTVNIGKDEPLKIVCGASNIAAGQKVPVAVVGTKLFLKGEELTIREAKIRGEQSFGMICAEDELGIGESHAGIMVLDSTAIPGTPAKEYFHVTEDEVFEIGLTPNRSDATSHIGVARDLATVMNHLATIGQGEEAKVSKPDVSHFKADNLNRVIEIIVEDTSACPRYSGLTISNVTVKESPEWVKSRLLAIGLRPINNIVDITNYILHETGQPLHAFDADKIAGGKVIIKKLEQGTPFVTLDEVQRELNAEDLMICNAEKPMCIAGVFGGIESGVSTQTRNLFLESAYFDPKTIRKTSKRHALQTDASFRFERGADPDITVFALKRAALLMKEVAGGEISSEVVDVYPNPLPKAQVDFTWLNLDRLTGQFIERNQVTGILRSLGIEILNETPAGLTLRIPSYKVDVLREVDVIEEVIRVYGYNNIGFSSALNSSVSFVEKPDREKAKNVVSDFLTSNGFYEIMNNSLTRSEYYHDNPAYPAEQSVRMVNPLSRDLDVMRQTLLYGGLESIVYNQNRRSPDLRFYEFGNTYRLAEEKSPSDPLHFYTEQNHLALFVTGKSSTETWNRPSLYNDFYDLKGFLHSILLRIGVDVKSFRSSEFSNSIIEKGSVYNSGDEPLVIFGSLRKGLLAHFDCKQEVFYADVNWDLLVSLLPKKEKAFRDLPKYPEVRRDLALLLDRSVSFSELEKIAFDTEKRLLKSVSLFDVYEGDKIGEGKKSYALSYVLQDPERTLKDDEIDSIMQKIVKHYAEKLNATLR
jgi:phenylalanyl-tRNA synthetase beta chain